MSTNNFQFKFDNFTLLPKEKLLVRDDEILPLSCRAFDVLFLLSQNEGKVTPKQELMDKVWENSHVEEGNLAVAINSLRKVLQTPERKNYIETFPKRGYRFNAQVEKIFVADESEVATDLQTELKQPTSLPISNLPLTTEISAVVPSKSAPRNALLISLPRMIQRKWLLLAVSLVILSIGLSITVVLNQANTQNRKQSMVNNTSKIAILPFVNLKPTTETEGLGVNFFNLLNTELSQTDGFTVVSAQSLENRLQNLPPTEQIKNETDVDLILIGTFIKADESLEVEYQLIEVKTGKVVLNDKENFSINQSDIFIKRLSFKIKLFSNVITSLKKEQ